MCVQNFKHLFSTNFIIHVPLSAIRIASTNRFLGVQWHLISRVIVFGHIFIRTCILLKHSDLAICYITKIKKENLLFTIEWIFVAIFEQPKKYRHSDVLSISFIMVWWPTLWRRYTKFEHPISFSILLRN